MNLFLFSFESITGLPVISGYLLIFFLGAVVGSFLNVVIHRVPNEQSIVFPNSACPKCKNPIKPYDNIPVLGWLLLGGKCRNCREKISARYPAVELLTALLFVLVFWQIGFNSFLPVALIFVSAMVALVFIDAEHMILPNVITYPLFVLALATRLFFPLFLTVEYFPDLFKFPFNLLQTFPLWLISLAAGLLGALVGGGFLWLVGEVWKRFRGVDAMGLGDVKMMLGVGALLGWRLTLLSIFTGAFTGALAGIFLLSKQKEKDLQMQIPFGIFLGIGSIVSLLFGEQILRWYFETFVY